MQHVDGTSRRTVLRGAVAAGALAWTAPVVQVVAPPAHAAGSPGPELSYVALLLQKDKTYYRVKYAFGDAGDGPAIEVEAGPDWAAGFCDQQRATSFYRRGEGLSTTGGKALSPGAPPPTVVAQYDVHGDGGFFVVLPIGVAILDWLVHQGSCCAQQPSTADDFATCQPEATSGVYKLQFLQYIEGPGGGNQWLFPAAPNDELCKTAGSAPYSQTCLPTEVTGKPRR